MRTINKTLKCKNCQVKFEATIIPLLGVPLIRGGGYCPACSDKIRTEEDKLEDSAIAGKIAEQRRRWRKSSGIPLKYRNEDFGTFKKRGVKLIDDAFNKCVDYSRYYDFKEPRKLKWLVLMSPKSWGTGKTHLACAIGHNIIDRWNGEAIAQPFLFISEPDIYRQIQTTYSFNDDEKKHREDEADIIRRLIGIRLLIIDDLGKEKRNEPKFIQRILYSIINGRYNLMLPMVITTNLSIGGLKQYLSGGGIDEASYERLIEMADFKDVSGESYRKVKRNGSTP